MKVTYDVTDAQVGDFKQPKPGLYEMKIVEATAKQSKKDNPMLELVMEVRKGEFKAARVWHYILTDGSQDWRLRELTDALGLKPKGSFDTDSLIGKVVSARLVGEDSDDYGYRARVKNLLKSAAADEDDEPEAEAEAEPDDTDDDYDEWSADELAEECEERELTIRGRKTTKKMIDALRADDAENGEEGDEAEEEAEEPEEAEAEAEEAADTDEEDDYSKWEMSELKEELEERGLRTVGRKSVLVARLEKDDKEGGDGDEPF